MIVFTANEGLFRIDETGGQPELLLEGASWATFPRLLPGGSGVLFTDDRTRTIAVLDLEAKRISADPGAISEPDFRGKLTPDLLLPPDPLHIVWFVVKQVNPENSTALVGRP